jgi:hypothetical protein
MCCYLKSSINLHDTCLYIVTCTEGTGAPWHGGPVQTLIEQLCVRPTRTTERRASVKTRTLKKHGVQNSGMFQEASASEMRSKSLENQLENWAETHDNNVTNLK